MSELVRVWYVSAQRLCNFRCSYCVSVDDYAKSNTEDWADEQERLRFQQIVRWIAARPFQVGVRLATLGEPFASRVFLTEAAWLSARPNVEYVELLTNGSLLDRRLSQLEAEGDLRKISLWITYHPGEIRLSRFIANARLAHERYGCFVVVNGLLFPDNEASIMKLKAAVDDAGLRFNLDLGYDPLTPSGALGTLGEMVPLFRRGGDGMERAIRLGANPELLELNVSALRNLDDRPCRAGHDYFYIGIRGDAYRCSRYQALGLERIGNVLDEGFELRLNEARWAPCRAGFGCGNKEDFLNLHDDHARASAPSLGWLSRRESQTSCA